MENKEYTLAPIWNKFPELFAYENRDVDSKLILQMISEMLVIGDYYYFVINLHQESISNVHDNILKSHPYSEKPTQLQRIIDLIHPEDLDYVLLAEETCNLRMSKLDPIVRQNYKSCYCFRMKIKNGKYHLFHHQSIPIQFDAEGRIISSLNIHTDIEHISKKNSYSAHLIGINDVNDFFQIDLSRKVMTGKRDNNPLTSREIEILRYIAKGFSSIKIAELLGISDQTVRVHRKNILKKTQTFNSSSLVKHCVEMGWL